MTPRKTPADWLKKYYPTPAQDVSEADALDHSIRKWEGLGRGILREHGMRGDGGDLFGSADFHFIMSVDSASCALCVHHLSAPKWSDRCETCPIKQFRGVRCDQSLTASNPRTPYSTFLGNGNPKPMLKLLKDTKAWLKEQQP